MTDKEKADFEKQKTDAEKKLSEMYFSSGQKDPKKGLKVPSFITPIQTENKSEKEQEINNKTSNKKAGPKKSGSFISENILNILNWNNIKMDNDRMLILAIILLLSGDSSDDILMISLLYILL